MDLTHFDENGNARMVDVTDKDITTREAIATGTIKLNKETFDAIKNKTVKKGDVLTVATTAGVMAIKKTFEIIPMCHVLNLTHASITWELDEEKLTATCISKAKCDGKTGVEMEALHGATAALLTVYDMVKAIDKTMEITDVYLLKKSGGKSGVFERKNK